MLLDPSSGLIIVDQAVACSRSQGRPYYFIRGKKTQLELLPEQEIWGTGYIIEVVIRTPHTGIPAI